MKKNELAELLNEMKETMSAILDATDELIRIQQELQLKVEQLSTLFKE